MTTMKLKMKTGGVGFLRGLLLSALLALGGVSPGAAAQDDDEAALLAELTALVAEVTDGTVGKLSELRAADGLTPEAARAVIRETASPHLDFAALSRGALGKHWRKADEAERARVAELFRGILEKTYAKALSAYAGQSAEILGASSLSEKKKSVRVEVSSGEQSAKIEYVFSRSADGEWRVADVKVEDVSLLASYRRQFSGIVRKEGIAGLIEKLAARAE